MKYPIWNISAKWDNANYANNGTSFSVMFRRKFSEKTMNKFAEKWFNKMIAKKYPDEKIQPNELKVKFIGEYSWMGTWFSHKTLTKFKTEAEAFEDLRRYMREEIDIRDIDGGYSTEAVYKDTGEKYCPMGLEDYWRWEWCQCKPCKRLKQTIIKH